MVSSCNIAPRQTKVVRMVIMLYILMAIVEFLSQPGALMVQLTEVSVVSTIPILALIECLTV